MTHTKYIISYLPLLQSWFFQLCRKEQPVFSGSATAVHFHLLQIAEKGLGRKEIVKIHFVPSMLEVRGEVFDYPSSQAYFHTVSLLASVHL